MLWIKNMMARVYGLKPVSASIFKKFQKTRNNPVSCFCNAAFVSMRIGIDGKVYACNHNSNFVLGQFPQQTLLEIWQGKQMRLLRKHLRYNDFSLGCGVCKEDAEKLRFDSASFSHFSRYPIGNMPSMLDFRLSNACNLKCIMCSGLSSSSFGEGSRNNTEIFDARFLDQLEVFIPHLHTARFIGGEPLAIPVYYDIWERIIARNPKCNIVIQTNGTILNERVKLLAEQGNVHFSVSIDSLQQDAYEQIRLGAKLPQVLSNIDFFSENARLRKREFVLCFCPMRSNYSEIPAFIAFANQKLSLICLNRFLYPAKLALWSLPSTEIARIISSFKETSFAPIKLHEQQNHQLFLEFLSLLNEYLGDAKAREQQVPTQDEIFSLFTQFRLGAANNPSRLQIIEHILAFPNQKAVYFYLKPVLHAYSLQLFFDFLDTADAEKIIEDIQSVSS